jgi:catechol 2,3-dioxygenase-like lactoylglutathione lyase family enzyme
MPDKFAQLDLGNVDQRNFLNSQANAMGVRDAHRGEMDRQAADPIITNVQEITISTDRLEQSVEFYQKHFGYRVVKMAELKEKSWQRLWGLPSGTTARAVLLQIPGYGEGSFRLVQFSPVSKVFIRVPFRALDTGHAGCDMTVSDLRSRVGALVDEGYNLASPFFSFVPPNTQATVTEVIVLGPTGERLPLVYYTPPGTQAAEPENPVYVPVVSAFQGVDNDIEQEASFYESLGLQKTRDRSFDLPAVNEAIGLPSDLRFRSIQLSNPGVTHGRVSLAQFYNYKGRNVSDRSAPPNLGILMVSFRTTDMENLVRTLKKAGAQVFAGPLELTNSLYGSCKCVTVRRPNGAWLEFYN